MTKTIRPMRKLFGTISIFLIGLVCVFGGFNINEPSLIALRGWGAVALFAGSIAVAIVLVLRGSWNSRGVTGRLLILLWCLPSLSMLGAYGKFEVGKRETLRTRATRAHVLGQHFVVGYTSFEEALPLAAKGLIAGIYITRHNVAGRSAEALKAEIARLQQARRFAGLPPLIVAADQEGGIVSHLAPPLTAVPALASLAGLPSELRAQRAEEFGHIHGQELAALGVNQNFAPVLDLRPAAGRYRFDFNTLIGQRAISSDPATVSEVALAYVRGLEASSVRATVKHFPGLGRVRADTHHFNAALDTPLEVLEAADWRPFRELLSGSKAQLMVGHVTLTAVDPDRPASHSKLVIDGVIRRQWNYQGVIMTDDLVMGAIYRHNVCTAVVEALNAGVDLLLVAYDGSQFYRIFACASAGLDRGELDAATLRESEIRLRRNVPEIAGKQAVGPEQPATRVLNN